jgi:Ca-activated chloride channel family protein
MVVFGEYAYVAAPLTFDHSILAAMVPHLQVGMAGERTAITDALAMAVKLLKKSRARSKVAILITDGRNTAGKVPFPVIERMLREYGIKLYTIGVGRRGEYNAALLKELAQKSGGKFFEANDAKMLQKVYAGIDRLEPSKVAARPVVETTYLYSPPLFVAAMCLLLYLFLMNRGEVA